jgi:hypothetical protein
MNRSTFARSEQSAKVADLPWRLVRFVSDVHNDICGMSGIALCSCGAMRSAIGSAIPKRH